MAQGRSSRAEVRPHFLVLCQQIRQFSAPNHAGIWSATVRLFRNEEMVRMIMQRKTRRRAGVALAAVGLISAGAGLGAAIAAVLIQQATDPTADFAAGSSSEPVRSQPVG